MPREIPAIETFRLMKCANQAVGTGGAVGETEISREWNSQARAGPPHLGGQGGGDYCNGEDEGRGVGGEGWRGGAK